MGASSTTGTGLGQANKKATYSVEFHDNNNVAFDATNQHPKIVAAGRAAFDEGGNATVTIPFWGRWEIQCEEGNPDSCDVIAELAGTSIAATYQNLGSADPISYKTETLAAPIFTNAAGKKQAVLNQVIYFYGTAGRVFDYIVCTIGVSQPNSAENFIL